MSPLRPENYRKLTPQACRALAEANQRHNATEKARQEQDPPEQEFNGPKGPEPTRYGDWERKGLASDF
jgi:hypothetical protein